MTPPGRARFTILRVAALLNPYIVGSALSDPEGDGFFGRDDVFSFVANSLQSAVPPPVVLYGQRRIGKSSVLRQLPRHLPPGTVAVFFDLQGQAALPLDALLYGLAREIASRCGVPRPGRDTIGAETFGDWLDGVCTTLGSPRRLVLLFDEFDVIDVGAQTSTAASSFLGYLATLVDRQPQIGYVLVVGRKVSELSEEFLGAILRKAVQHRLGRLEEKHSNALATRLGDATLRFSDAALKRLFELAAGHPYCTQLLCNVLWQRCVTPQRELPVTVQPTDLDAALPQAIEYGTSGLNWIYDGLDVPSHRLFLAALAELQGERADASVTMADIERRLLSRGSLIDAAELRQAPARLANWDVVDGSASQGYRFAVPMIGLWIRLNRPLVELEQETRLVNPRAWRLYELAVLGQERSEFDSAVDLYEQALAVNPALVEAHLGRAASFRARNAPGDLRRAIEAYERALDLDPSAPRAALLDALSEEIDHNGSAPPELIKDYKRIVELDAAGPAAQRAQRALQQFAQLRLPFRNELGAAEALFSAIGDSDGLAAVARERALYRPYERVSGIAFGTLIGGIALAFVPFDGWFGWPASVSDMLRLACVAIGIGALWLGAGTQNRPPAWRLGLSALIAAATVGALGAFGVPLFAAGFGGFIIGAMSSGLLVKTTPLPPELSPPQKTSSERPLADMALRAAQLLQRFAQRSEEKKR